VDFNDTTWKTSGTYREGAIITLANMFPFISRMAVRTALRDANYHFTPGLRLLRERIASGEAAKTKRERTPTPPPLREDPLLVRELRLLQQEADAELAEQLNEAEHAESGQLLECGCCFEGMTFEQATACTDGHVFCKGCARKATNALLEKGKYRLACLEAGCEFEFSLGSARQFLDKKTLAFYERQSCMQELRELKSSGAANVVECPFCDFALILENEEERVFRCKNPRCRKESCILCKQPNHLPLRCKEVHVQKAVRFIEERMTDALIRTCPRCSKKFVKEIGCNKMTCTCGAMICYLCKKQIRGYGHFKDRGGSSNCELFSKDERFEKEVLDTAAAAAKELQQLQGMDLTSVQLPSVKGVGLGVGTKRTATVAGFVPVIRGRP